MGFYCDCPEWVINSGRTTGCPMSSKTWVGLTRTLDALYRDFRLKSPIILAENVGRKCRWLSPTMFFRSFGQHTHFRPTEIVSVSSTLFKQPWLWLSTMSPSGSWTSWDLSFAYFATTIIIWSTVLIGYCDYSNLRLQWHFFDDFQLLQRISDIMTIGLWHFC